MYVCSHISDQLVFFSGIGIIFPTPILQLDSAIELILVKEFGTENTGVSS